MKKIIISLALVGACHSSPPTPAATPRTSVAQSGGVGAADATSAVRGFMVAAKNTDMTAMGALWGDQTTLARDQFPREELQKRELIIMRCLRHDTYDIVGDAPSLGGARSVVVQVSYGQLTRSANMEVVRGPSDRWYVKNVDLVAVQDICMQRG